MTLKCLLTTRRRKVATLTKHLIPCTCGPSSSSTISQEAVLFNPASATSPPLRICSFQWVIKIDRCMTIALTTRLLLDLIQLTMKLASIYDARANDITIKFGMYTASENMPLHKRRRSVYAGKLHIVTSVPRPCI